MRRAAVGAFSFSLWFFSFQLTNWQLIDGYLLRPTKNGISMTKETYSRVGQTVNYMLPLDSSLSSLFSHSPLLARLLIQPNIVADKQNKVCFLSLMWALKQHKLTVSFEGDTGKTWQCEETLTHTCTHTCGVLEKDADLGGEELLEVVGDGNIAVHAGSESTTFLLRGRRSWVQVQLGVFPGGVGMFSLCLCGFTQ